jgi:hypothetical protein
LIGAFFRQYPAKNGDTQQKYRLSKQILNSCSNFVVSPAHFDGWSSEKRAAITEYFCKTLFESHIEVESESLYLF